MSISERVEDLNDDLDTMHNQRNDAWQQSIGKQYKKKRGAEVHPDPKEHTPQPRDVFEVDNMDDLLEFNKMPTAVPNFIQEENLNVKYLDLSTSLTEGLSGRESPTDPRAPAAKMAMQRADAGIGIGDYVEALRPGFNKVGEQILWLEYQYGPDEYKNSAGQVLFTKQDINPENLHMKVYAVDESVNQAATQEESLFILQTVGAVPIIAQNPNSQRELVDNVLTAYGKTVEEKNRINPTEEQIQEQQARAIVDAMRMKEEEDAAKQDEMIDNMATKMGEADEQ